MAVLYKYCTLLFISHRVKSDTGYKWNVFRYSLNKNNIWCMMKILDMIKVTSTSCHIHYVHVYYIPAFCVWATYCIHKELCALGVVGLLGAVWGRSVNVKVVLTVAWGVSRSHINKQSQQPLTVLKLMTMFARRAEGIKDFKSWAINPLTSTLMTGAK